MWSHPPPIHHPRIFMSVSNAIPRSNGDDYCQKLKPQEKAIYIRDSQVKGLVLRVKPTGSKSWIFCYSVPCPKRKWRERKKGLGPFRMGRNDVAGLTVNAARIEAERLKNEVRHKQADPVEDKRKLAAEIRREKASNILVNELFERWFDADLVNRKDKGAEARRMMLKDALPIIGHLNIKEVQKSHIFQITDELLKRGVNRMAKVVFSLIRQMFRFAVARDLLQVDPTTSISKISIGGSNVERDRVLSEDELKELAKRLPEANMKDTSIIAIWIILSTCCRIGEILRARWSHFDMNRRTWEIPAGHSKNEKEHTVFLSDFTFDLIQKLQAITGYSEWCFPTKEKNSHICVKTITKQVSDRQRKGNPYTKRAQQTDILILSKGIWKPHDLRRTGATLMTSLGVLPEVAERCLNHAEENKIKRIYQRYGYEPEMKQAWERLGDHLDKLITEKSHH